MMFYSQPYLVNVAVVSAKNFLMASRTKVELTRNNNEKNAGFSRSTY